VTEKEVVFEVSRRTGVDVDTARTVIREFLEVITKSLEVASEVRLEEFGKFFVTSYMLNPGGFAKASSDSCLVVKVGFKPGWSLGRRVKHAVQDILGKSND